MSSSFLSYVRPGTHAVTGDGPAGGARRSGLLKLLFSPTGGVPVLDSSLSFELLGIGDVGGLSAVAISRRHPAPGVVDASPELAAHVEFAAQDLPWRYAPHAPKNGAMQPWLVLLVGLDGEEVCPIGRTRVSVAPSVLAACDLSQSHLWAHVHVVDSGAPTSRVVSPCVLAERKSYRAALVPAFRIDGAGNVVAAWTGTPLGPVELPLYDTWTFSTGEKDDFPILAARLQMVTATQLGPGFGTTLMRLADQPAGGSFPMLGALVRPGESDNDPAPSVRRWSQLSDADASGRWVLGPPQYDEPWRSTPVAGLGWPEELRDDPRRRAAAGLGAFCAITHQDQLAEGARRQAGALELAAHDLRLLGVGLAAGRYLFKRRLPPRADGVGRLSVLGPLLRRLPSLEGGTADRALRDRTPRLHPSLLSGALRRLIRPGSSIAVQAHQPPSVEGLLEAANVCPQPERPGVFTKALRGASGEAPTDRLLDIIERWPQLRALREAAVAEGRELAAQSRLVAAPSERSPCDSIDLGGLGNLLADAIDPRQADPPARRRVLGRYKGLGVPPEPVFEPELDLPLAMVLKDLAPQWLLPGRGALPPDRIVPLAANARFTDAALVGANHRALGELRWRNVRVRSGWSPLRHFWPHPEAPDIVPLRGWGATALGAAAHRPPGLPSDLLVVVIRSPILRRFPATAIYLLGAGVDPDRLREIPPALPVTEAERTLPVFQGAIEPDLHYLGFPITPAAAQGLNLVLEEPPAKPRFRRAAPFLSAPANATNGAAFAAATFHSRTIAVIAMPADVFQ